MSKFRSFGKMDLKVLDFRVPSLTSLVQHKLPVNGGHLRFTTHIVVREYSHKSHRVAGPR